MTEFRIWLYAAFTATALMLSFNDAKAAPSSYELCTWGKWAWQHDVTLEDLVDALNSVEEMPYKDKEVVVKCFKIAKDTI